MCTETEMTAIDRDRAELAVADLIDSDFQGHAFDEILEIAINKAIDEFDAAHTEDGFVDCTNYESCAIRAQDEWLQSAHDMYEAMQDDRANAMAER